MIHKHYSARKDKVVVTFEIPSTIWTESVHLVGDFNNWDTRNMPFRRNWKGDWAIEVELNKGRSYRFRYLFDQSNWGNDWQADGHVENRLGCDDSIVLADVHPEVERKPAPFPAMGQAVVA